jgi:hypothetical protein
MINFAFPNPFIAWICHFTIYAQPVPTFCFHLLDYLWGYICYIINI